MQGSTLYNVISSLDSMWVAIQGEKVILAACMKVKTQPIKRRNEETKQKISRINTRADINTQAQHK